MRLLLLFLFFILTVEAAIVENSYGWSTVSQYALGVWKYYNSTTILSTIPHS